MNTEKLKTLSEVDLRDEKWIDEILDFINKFIYCGGGIAHEDVMDFARSVIYLANEKFEAIVASHEREECAKIADEFAGDCWIGNADWEAAEYIAAKIRARGKV
jgi:hypothetical protein